MNFRIAKVIFKDGWPTHGWRLPRGGGRAQRDPALKLIASRFARIQSWDSC